jgi:hypothetical protein
LYTVCLLTITVQLKSREKNHIFRILSQHFRLFLW